MDENANDDEIAPTPDDPERSTRETSVVVRPEDLGKPDSVTFGVHAADD